MNKKRHTIADIEDPKARNHRCRKKCRAHEH